jgi:RimJ/RimL family protein N-acetyltransferase
MYKIRYANTNDAKALGEIHSKSWYHAYKGIVPDKILENLSSQKMQKRFEGAINKSEENAIIFKNNKPVGFIYIGKCRDEDKPNTCGEVWGIYLHPDYWNMGIGTKLINWGLNELKNRNFNQITLWVLEENTNARKFYEKIGFKHDGTAKEIILGKKLTEIRYEKFIT